MEFLDEESRPKLLFQSRFSSNQSPSSPQKLNKPITFFCISISTLLSLLTIFFLSSETITFHLLLWFSLSLFLGPFAPLSITGGDIRVGQGEILEEPIQFDEDLKKQVGPTRRKFRKPEELVTPGLVIEKEKVVGDCNGEKVGKEEEKDLVFEEKEWTDGDFDMLKKQIGKYPVGTVKRWEMIAQVFKGRHAVESVIKMGKSWNEKKPGGGDSFMQFLKQRKPLDKRMEEGSNGKKESEGDEWSSGEDIALLNALKAFPKDVSMRWEKIAAAVPSKTKASCVKRVAELKKGFRSSKASAE